MRERFGVYIESQYISDNFFFIYISVSVAVLPTGFLEIS